MTEEVRANIKALAEGVLSSFGGVKIAAKDPVFYAAKATLRTAFRKAGYRNVDCELTDKLRIAMAGMKTIIV